MSSSPSYLGSGQPPGSCWSLQTEHWGRSNNMTRSGSERRTFQWTTTVTTNSPRLLHREAVDSQHSPQCILGAVYNVLLRLIVQLLLHDVLTEVEHYLQAESKCSGWRSRLEVWRFRLILKFQAEGSNWMSKGVWGSIVKVQAGEFWRFRLKFWRFKLNWRSKVVWRFSLEVQAKGSDWRSEGL